MQTPTESTPIPITKTNAFTLLTLFVRLAAVFGFVQVFYVSTAQLIVSGPGFVRDWGVMWIVLFVGAALGVFAAMWIYADKIARLTLARNTGEYFDSTVDAAQWQHIALSILGVFLAANHAVDLFQTLRFWLIARASEPSSTFTPDQLDSYVLHAIDSGFGIALGIGLMLGARGLSGLLHRLRTAGQPQTPTSDA